MTHSLQSAKHIHIVYGGLRAQIPTCLFNLPITPPHANLYFTFYSFQKFPCSPFLLCLCICCSFCWEWNSLTLLVSQSLLIHSLSRKPPDSLPMCSAEHPLRVALSLYCRCLVTDLPPSLHQKLSESRTFISFFVDMTVTDIQNAHYNC